MAGGCDHLWHPRGACCTRHRRRHPSAGSRRAMHPTCQRCLRPQAKPGRDFAVYGDDGGSIRADDRVGRLVLRWGLGSSGAGAEQLPNGTARAAWWVRRSVSLRAGIRNSAVLEDPDLCLPRYQSYDPAACRPCKPSCLAPPRAAATALALSHGRVHLSHAQPCSRRGQANGLEGPRAAGSYDW